LKNGERPTVFSLLAECIKQAKAAGEVSLKRGDFFV
jgi:hypothetical protein